jgi:hypothetical protein
MAVTQLGRTLSSSPSLDIKCFNCPEKDKKREKGIATNKMEMDSCGEREGLRKNPLCIRARMGSKRGEG